jgi:hypothetical protein
MITSLMISALTILAFLCVDGPDSVIRTKQDHQLVCSSRISDQLQQKGISKLVAQFLGGGFLIHSEPFHRSILICFVSIRSSSVAPTHLIRSPTLTKNLSDLAAVSKTALEHTVASL